MNDIAVQVVFDPHVVNAIYLILLAIIILLGVKFRDYVNRRANDR